MSSLPEELKQELIIESVLFASGKPVRMTQVCKVLQCDVQVARSLMDRLIRKHARPDHALKIVELESGFQLCSKPEYYDYINLLRQDDKKLNISNSVMETLSIIAYRQPCTRADIEWIRGVSSDFAINKLLDYGFIVQSGRSDGPGHPAIFTTTDLFLREFGLKSLDDIPAVRPEEEKKIIEATSMMST